VEPYQVLLGAQGSLVQQRCVWLCLCQHWLWEVPLRLFQGKIKDEWCSDCLCVACMQLRLCDVGQTSMSDTERLRPGQAGPCLWCTVMT
jgi:hypothetical protein